MKTRINNGYILEFRPEHPFAHKNGYVLQHRYFMEKHILRYLKKSEQIHHINGDRADNRIENLYLCRDAQEHAFIHLGKDLEQWLEECADRTFFNASKHLRKSESNFLPKNGYFLI